MFGCLCLITRCRNNLCILDKQCDGQIRLNLIALKSIPHQEEGTLFSSFFFFFNDTFKCFYVNIALFTSQVRGASPPVDNW